VGDTAHAPLVFWTPRRRRAWTIVGVGAFLLTSFQAISWWHDNHAFLINATDSLPYWAFLLEKKQPAEVGEFIFFKPPPSKLLATHFGAGEHLFGKRVFGVAEMMEWVKTGEAALSGTAAVLAGVGTLVRSDGTDVQVGNGDVGPVTQQLRAALVAIQNGTAPDTFGWTRKV
jgi:hypothetical protein